MTLDSFETNRRGILNPREGAEHYVLDRHRPMPALEPWVELHWQVTWDLRGRAPYEQETLPHPCVNLVLGTHRDGLHGPVTSRFVARLADAGWVFGTKFRAGMFRTFTGTSLSELTNRVLSPEEAFGEAGPALEGAIGAERVASERVRRVGEFLHSLSPKLDSDAQCARDAVEVAQRERCVTRSDALAERAGLSVRALQRLFDEHVGVTPKWVIQRFRVQEAAELAAAGTPPDWASLALALGYADQSHFIRDFKAQVGRTPAEYAALCTPPSERSA
jgi:AraC-like DNA-binding protein